jgi:hypothetical protein
MCVAAVLYIGISAVGTLLVLYVGTRYYWRWRTRAAEGDIIQVTRDFVRKHAGRHATMKSDVLNITRWVR